jgi:hypothetical protein
MCIAGKLAGCAQPLEVFNCVLPRLYPIWCESLPHERTDSPEGSERKDDQQDYLKQDHPSNAASQHNYSVKNCTYCHGRTGNRFVTHRLVYALIPPERVVFLLLELE